MSPENADNKIPDVGMDEKIVEKAPSPYKSGLEKLSKLDIFKVIQKEDYVDSFQKESKLELEIRKQGPTSDRSMKKAMLKMSMGEDEDAVTAADDALIADPNMQTLIKQNLLYIKALALLRLAMEEDDLIPSGPQVKKSGRSVKNILQEAEECLTNALELDPADDQVKEVLNVVTAILESVLSQQERSK